MIAGVDIGTTSAKAAVFGPDGTCHAEVDGPPHELAEPRPGWAVQDPEEVVGAALGVLRDILAAGPPVQGVAFSTAMHSLVGVDAGGAPLTDLITWADTRAVAQAERLRAGHAHLHDRTGTPLHPMSPLAKLCWLREHEPELAGRVARWCQVKDLVLHRLTGEWVTDHSSASGTGLLDLRSLDWEPEALGVAGVRGEQLPRLVPATAVLRGRRAGPPLVAGAADGPLANLGLGAVRPGVAAISIGTSGAVRVMVEEPRVDGRRSTFCYALVPGRWAVGGSINNGGVVLEWAGEALAPELGDEPEEALLAAAAEVPPGSEGLVMLPSLLSERAPRWRALERGAYVGLTRAHGRGHLVRAALEGVCQQLALVLDSVREAGYAVDEVRATGGFARSPFWRQLLADVLGMPVGFAEGHQGSAFGAALVGMQALGLVGSVDVAAELVEVDEVREPDPDAAGVYARLRPVVAGLAGSLEPAFLALREESRLRESQRG